MEPLQPMDYIFISYSHLDREYVTRLTKALEDHHLPYWVDERIDYSSSWPRVIEEYLDRCAVFLLIMTPTSYASEWVQNELARAQLKKKFIFPLLLEGDSAWLSVQILQYADVRNRELPPTKFFETIRRYLSISAQDDAPKSSFPVSPLVGCNKSNLDYELIPIEKLVIEKIPIEKQSK
jgi:hypothetical protein